MAVAGLGRLRSWRAGAGLVCLVGWWRDIRVGEGEVRVALDTDSMGVSHIQLGVKCHWIYALVAEEYQDMVRYERLSILCPSSRTGHRPTRLLFLPFQHLPSPPRQVRAAPVVCRALEEGLEVRRAWLVLAAFDR